MILGPLDVEDTPALINLLVAQSFDSASNEVYRSTVLRVELDTNGGPRTNRRQFLHRFEIVGLRIHTLTEENDCP